MSAATQPPRSRPHHRDLPLRVGTRGSPLALIQTRSFLEVLRSFCPVLRDMNVFEEHPIRTTGDVVQDRRLTEIGGKGLFAKEIHEALLDRRIDFAVHSLKDLETELPAGIVLACTLRREDARDVLILRERSDFPPPLEGGEVRNVFSCLPIGAVIGTASVRRQAQLLHVRPDLRIVTLRGNVQTRLDKLANGAADATVLAAAGLRRLGIEHPASIMLDPDQMVPAAGQGIIAVTVRSDDAELIELLGGIADPESEAAASAERAVLAALDGSCRTPIGAYARLSGDGWLRLTGLAARPDGSFLLKRSLEGAAADARRIGAELGAALRADSPADLFA